MRFYTLKEKKPEYEEKVLVKIRSFYPAEEGEFYYYVVCRTTKNVSVVKEGKWVWEEQEIYEEAMGEQYAYWEEKGIIGWTSFNEIEKAEKWQGNEE